MAEASVTFAVGGEQATVVLPVDLPGGETIITGDFGGLVAAGTTARLRGNVRLIDNMHVRGTLLCDPTGVDLDGQNLFDIHTHDGTLNLVGTEKTAWTGWGGRRFVGDPVVPVAGWVVGDRLAVAPTAKRFDGAGKRLLDDFQPIEMTWSGDWATMVRPVKCPDVVMVDGRVALPEVANLSQTATFRNLKRIMIHEATVPNPHTLKWIKVLNCGETGVLGNYPIHFHMIGDHAQGSMIEGVVVEGGKNHAFVPHASHGITIKGSVAYKTTGDPFWWDPPPDPLPGETDAPILNDTNDADWDSCLVLHSVGSGVGNSRATGFTLARGLNNRCVDSVASCVQGNLAASEGNRQRSGFAWQEGTSGESWQFQRDLAHNNVDSGILVWQNARKTENLIEDFTAYNNGFEGINHGSYTNRYQYRGAVLTGNGFRQHAKSAPEGALVIEDIVSDSPLTVTEHNSAFTLPTYYRRCTVAQVIYIEGAGGAGHGTYNIYEDCDLIPTDFSLVNNPTPLGLRQIADESIIEIKQGGVLTFRWATGVWS